MNRVFNAGRSTAPAFPTNNTTASKPVKKRFKAEERIVGDIRKRRLTRQRTRTPRNANSATRSHPLRGRSQGCANDPRTALASGNQARALVAVTGGDRLSIGSRVSLGMGGEFRTRFTNVQHYRERRLAVHLVGNGVAGAVGLRHPFRRVDEDLALVLSFWNQHPVEANVINNDAVGKVFDFEIDEVVVPVAMDF